MLSRVKLPKEIRIILVAGAIIGLVIIGLMVFALLMSSETVQTMILTTIINASLNGATTFLVIRYLSKGLDRIEKQGEKKE